MNNQLLWRISKLYYCSQNIGTKAIENELNSAGVSAFIYTMNNDYHFGLFSVTCDTPTDVGTSYKNRKIIKIKWSRYRPGLAQRVGRGIALLFHDRGTRRSEWSAAQPGRTLPPGKTWYPYYMTMGGPRSRSGRAENLVPTGIRSRTVQPVVSRCTDWATRLTS